MLAEIAKHLQVTAVRGSGLLILALVLNVLGCAGLNRTAPEGEPPDSPDYSGPVVTYNPMHIFSVDFSKCRDAIIQVDPRPGEVQRTRFVKGASFVITFSGGDSEVVKVYKHSYWIRTESTTMLFHWPWRRH